MNYNGINACTPSTHCSAERGVHMHNFIITNTSLEKCHIQNELKFNFSVPVIYVHVLADEITCTHFSVR